MVLPCCHEWAPALLAPDPGRSATPTSWLRREGERSSPPLSLGSRRLPRGNAASRQVARRLELLAPPPQRPRSSEPSARDSHREQLARPADDRVVVGDRRGGRASVVPSGLPVGERLRALGDVAGTREVSVVVHDRLAVAVAVHAADVSALEHAAVRVEVPGGRGAFFCLFCWLPSGWRHSQLHSAGEKAEVERKTTARALAMTYDSWPASIGAS